MCNYDVLYITDHFFFKTQEEYVTVSQQLLLLEINALGTIMTWSIVKVNNNTSAPTQAIVMKDCRPVVGTAMNGDHRIIVGTLGYLDLVDLGRSGGHWAIDFNGQVFYYEGGGQVTLAIENDGAFTASGDINTVQGKLKPYYA